MAQQQESKEVGNMEDISDMGAVIQSLKSELDQSEKRYLSAVKGRKEFRQLYRKSRDAQNESRNKIAQLEKENRDAINDALSTYENEIGNYIINEKKLREQLQSYKELIEEAQFYVGVCRGKGINSIRGPKPNEWIKIAEQLLKDAE